MGKNRTANKKYYNDIQSHTIFIKMKIRKKIFSVNNLEGDYTFSKKIKLKKAAVLHRMWYWWNYAYEYLKDD